MTNATCIDVIISVDNLKEVHATVTISGPGAYFTTTAIAASNKGYAALEAWAKAMGEICAFGIEGTGALASPCPAATAQTK